LATGHELATFILVGSDEYGPRRRQHLRHPCEVALQAKCSSWDRFHNLFSGNISEGGLFIPTEEPAKAGEVIAIELTVPDGSRLELPGRVTHVIRDPDGNQHGLGIKLEVPEGDARKRYDELVQVAAQHCEVRPAEGELAEEVEHLFEDSAEIPIDVGKPPPPLPPGATPPPPPVPASVSVPTAAPPKARKGPPPIPPPLPAHVRRAPSPSTPIVGIDFGTTRSCVAVVERGEVQVLHDKGGAREIPSVVGILEDGSVAVGFEAQRLRTVDPSCVLASPKRMLGRLHSDPELEPYLPTLAVSISQGRSGEILVHAHHRTYSIVQLCSALLFALRKRAEEHLQQEVSRVVMTAPVSFDEYRLGALRHAARMAGLTPLEIIDEPTAAAMAQNFDRRFGKLGAVYDFGGGTFDFSVVDASTADLQVVATAGDTWLGGDDLDDAVAGDAANAFWRQHNIELRHQVVTWQRLLLAAEQAKRTLSSREEATVELAKAALSPQGPLGLRHHITRAQFAQLVEPIIGRSLDTCREAMYLADVKTDELTAIYLSGGTTYVPAVRDAVTRFFGKPPRVMVPPDRAVVMGAAMHAARLHNERVFT
jgi:molecular chaperone DnaK